MNSALAHYWTQSDDFGRAVALLLIGMSLLSWSVIFARGWMLWRVRRAAAAMSDFWQAGDWQQAMQALQQADPEKIYLALAADAAFAADPAARQRSFAGARAEQVLTRVLRSTLQKLTVRLEAGLTLLASIGATAPFVGLLGTVWGIYHALSALAASGQVQIDQLVGPVGEALIMTAFGLMVAIPAVLAYNGLQRAVRLTQAELDGFAHDLQQHFGGQS